MLKAAALTLTEDNETELQPEIDTGNSAIEIIDLPASIEQLYQEKEVQLAMKQLALGHTVTFLKQYKIDQALVTARNNRLYITNRFYRQSLLIPSTDSEVMYKIRIYLIYESYSTPLAGHPRVAKTFGLLTRLYI